MIELRKQPAAYFDTFTARFLRDGAPEAVDIEVVAPDWGDQQPVLGARLIGITYDADTRTLEFAFDVGDRARAMPDPRPVLSLLGDDDAGVHDSLAL